MALFFSRRAYNASRQRFTNNFAQKTRYVSLTAQNADGTVQTGSAVPQSDWLDLVRQDGGDSDVLVFVHGFNTSQFEMLDRLDKIRNGVRGNGFQGAVIAYDWPSDGSVTAYDPDRADAKKSATSLVADGILPLLAMPNRPKVHVMAHSMGAFLVLRALADFGDAAAATGQNWRADQIMFVAGDADAAWLAKGAWGSLVLKQRSARFTNYYSGRDDVLALADGLINGGRDRVGRHGMPPPRDSAQWDIYGNAQYTRHVPEADQTKRYSHTWWFDNDGFYDDVSRTLNGEAGDAMPTRRITNVDDLALWT